MEARADPPDPGAQRNVHAQDPTEKSAVDNVQQLRKKPKESKGTGRPAKTKLASTSMGEQDAADMDLSTAADQTDEEPISSNEMESRSTKPISFNEGFVQLQQAMANDTTDSEEGEGIIVSLVQSLFAKLFEQHKVKELSEEKAHYPQVPPDEIGGLERLLKMAILQHDGTAQQWQRALRDLTASIYRSKDSLLEAIALKESNLKVQHARTENPWSHNPLLDTAQADTDEPTEEVYSTVVRFKTDVYSTEEIATMRQVFETPYDFLRENRAPTEMEMKITQGLLEGTILAQEMSQFLK